MNNNLLKYKSNRLLPYMAALAIIVILAIQWKCFLCKDPWIPIDSLSNFLPLIIISLGLLIAAFLGIFISLIQRHHQRTLSLHLMEQDFKQELAKYTASEEGKQKLERALQQGQKLQAIGTLAGGIAHDFNNILYAIMGYVDMARDDVEKNSLVYNNLGKVLEASRRGQELIARILEFSRRNLHDLKPLRVQATIESVLSLLRPTVPASITIIFKAMQQDCMIMGNQTQLHQVIVNIINNAVDAMDGEGTVTLTSSIIPASSPLLKQFPAIKAGNYCKIDISDTGYGMEQSTVERIFEPFFTTKEVGKGTGLGLSTVHAILRDHQSEVLVTSQLGRGTTFTLLIPEHKENENGENSIS